MSQLNDFRDELIELLEKHQIAEFYGLSAQNMAFYLFDVIIALGQVIIYREAENEQESNGKVQ